MKAPQISGLAMQKCANGEKVWLGRFLDKKNRPSGAGGDGPRW
jgi:hypothetical protein